MTKGAERSGALAPEAVWCGRAGGLWRDHGQETLGSWPPTKTGAGALGRRPPGPGPGRPKGSERGTDSDAGYDGEREQALPYGLRYLATTLMRGVNRHSLWRVYPDTVCASSRDGCLPGARKLLQVARQRLLAEAGGIAAGV